MNVNRHCEGEARSKPEIGDTGLLRYARNDDTIIFN
jgi:hypothetical protein